MGAARAAGCLRLHPSEDVVAPRPTMPPEGWDRQRSGAGGALGAAAPARTGAGGADGLVENHARMRIHSAHHGGAGGGPEPT
jgi:hypothetical protein